MKYRVCYSQIHSPHLHAVLAGVHGSTPWMRKSEWYHMTALFYHMGDIRPHPKSNFYLDSWIFGYLLFIFKAPARRRKFVKYDLLPFLNLCDSTIDERIKHFPRRLKCRSNDRLCPFTWFADTRRKTRDDREEPRLVISQRTGLRRSSSSLCKSIRPRFNGNNLWKRGLSRVSFTWEVNLNNRLVL